VGYNKSVAIQCWPAYAPRTFFVSNGLSSMGYGLPAAIGLKLAHPDRAVACILGDGGFAMSLAELETAARLGLALTVVVLADEALQQIKAAQARKEFPARGPTFGWLGPFDVLTQAAGQAVELRDHRFDAGLRLIGGDAAVGADGVQLLLHRVDEAPHVRHVSFGVVDAQGVLDGVGHGHAAVAGG